MAENRCHLCRSLVQHGLGKQQQQQQSPVLYSPTSALQNACCGCTGAQLQASASSSARHRTSSASVPRTPLTENGIFINTDATFDSPSSFLCAAQMLCSVDPAARSSVPLRFCLLFVCFLPTETWRRQQHRTVRSLSSGAKVRFHCVLGGPWRCLRNCLSFRECFRFCDQGGFIKLLVRLLPSAVTTEPAEGAASSGWNNRSFLDQKVPDPGPSI